MLTFSAWLRQQTEEDTPTGDLARDMLIDEQWPCEANDQHILLHHLKRMYACEDAIRAFHTAWQAYRCAQQQLNGSPHFTAAFQAGKG
ncbi:MAG TPA: YozE family protein [Ktedonobacteraceae bacterium]|jgi:uncharacterized protein YozE (UPF0346 family)